MTSEHRERTRKRRPCRYVRSAGLQCRRTLPGLRPGRPRGGSLKNLPLSAAPCFHGTAPVQLRAAVAPPPLREPVAYPGEARKRSRPGASQGSGVADLSRGSAPLPPGSTGPSSRSAGAVRKRDGLARGRLMGRSTTARTMARALGHSAGARALAGCADELSPAGDGSWARRRHDRCLGQGRTHPYRTRQPHRAALGH